MSEMTWDDFLQHEEEKEKQRRIKRLAEELKPATAAKPAPKSKADKKAEQRAQLNRIMDDAHKRYIENNKKKYDLAQPPNNPETWLVFDRVTGELYGESTKLRAFQAWAEVNPTRLVKDEKKPDRNYLVAVGFNACRCVLKSEWLAAEEQFRNKKRNGAAK